MHAVLNWIADPKVARALADYHEAIARAARSHAALLELRAETWAPKIRPQVAPTPLAMLESYIVSGNTADAAALAVAAQTGIVPDALLQSYKAHRAARERQSRRERNAAILALAGRGARDKEIAAEFGLHRKHVNKIIRAAIRRNQRRSLPAEPAHVG